MTNTWHKWETPLHALQSTTEQDLKVLQALHATSKGGVESIMTLYVYDGSSSALEDAHLESITSAYTEYIIILLCVKAVCNVT